MHAFVRSTRLCFVLIAISVLVVVVLLIRQGGKKELVSVWNDPKTAPLIFVGGSMSSGTTLMRVLLDTHPSIRCGPEGMLILPVLEMPKSLSEIHMEWAKFAGFYPKAYNYASPIYILQMIRYSGEPADRLCYKRPEILLHIVTLAEFFPEAQFVLMLRDGRAAAYSDLKRGLLWSNLPEKAMQMWSDQQEIMVRGCQNLGPDRCLIIRYELLVLRTEEQVKRLVTFLKVPWDPTLLHHTEKLNTTKTLNPIEPSTSQVMKEINPESLDKWAKGKDKVKEFMQRAHIKYPMLEKLEYGSHLGIPPKYDKLSSVIPIL